MIFLVPVPVEWHVIVREGFAGVDGEPAWDFAPVGSWDRPLADGYAERECSGYALGIMSRGGGEGYDLIVSSGERLVTVPVDRVKVDRRYERVLRALVQGKANEEGAREGEQS